MLTTFETIKKNFKIKPQAYHIDNLIFRMHYRVTTLIFLVATLLVTSRQYIGEHIKCISDKGVPEHVMNTFCFFTTTFTVINHYDDKMVRDGHVAHPGVGSYGFNSTAPIQRHAYYQWVPFVLFGQAIMFHLTHLIWKKFEGGRIRRLIEGLQLGAFALLEKEVSVDNKKIPSKEKKAEFMATIRKAFIDRIYFNKSWSRWLVFCEILNVANVILQVYISDVFLSHQFLTLGTDVIEDGDETVTTLDEVFPKVTKCTFHKFGPSGTIQLHDAMCVMALNIINEKIYIFLWFWFIILFILSCLGVFWRFMTILLHSRSRGFNRLAFATSCPGKLDPWQMLTVTQKCDFTDWLFLKYLAKNMDALVFRELFLGLAEDLEETKKPLIYLDSDEEAATLKKPRKFD
ncbi:innexin inx7-like [Tribolium madens]|uniref:innexin inx7-like n=1 Tax=Tribolium madens TaxID=41895 RepID=UPI001CF74413|nr:innexin inx7-like [Tribolium madens]